MLIEVPECSGIHSSEKELKNILSRFTSSRSREARLAEIHLQNRTPRELPSVVVASLSKGRSPVIHALPSGGHPERRWDVPGRRRHEHRGDTVRSHVRNLLLGGAVLGHIIRDPRLSPLREQLRSGLDNPRCHLHGDLGSIALRDQLSRDHRDGRPLARGGCLVAVGPLNAPRGADRPAGDYQGGFLHRVPLVEDTAMVLGLNRHFFGGDAVFKLIPTRQLYRLDVFSTLRVLGSVCEDPLARLDILRGGVKAGTVGLGPRHFGVGDGFSGLDDSPTILCGRDAAEFGDHRARLDSIGECRVIICLERRLELLGRGVRLGQGVQGGAQGK